MLFPRKVSHSLLTLERLVLVEYSNSPLVQVKSIGQVKIRRQGPHDTSPVKKIKRNQHKTKQQQKGYKTGG